MQSLIKNTKLLSAKRQDRESHDIYIIDGKIAAIDNKPEGFTAGKTIDGRGMLAIPGLINTHGHLYMTLLRNYADDLPFDTWLFKRVMPVEDTMASEDAYWSSLLGMMEMIKGGITCYADMHMFPGQSPKAAEQIGMRGVISRGLSGGNSDKEGGERRLQEALEEYEEFKNSPNLSFMLAPHAPYTCDEDYLRQIAQVAREKNLPINTHLCETAFEVETVRKEKGCSPIEYFDNCGLFDGKAVAAHCVYLDDKDIELLAEKAVSVSLNPASNLKLANGIAPVPKLMAAGVNCALGTDSTASNNSLSILREMGLTALLHKGISGDPCAVSAMDTFLMATQNAAKAMGLSGCGELEPGANADIAMFNLDSPGLTPLGDPASALCYAGAGLIADTVFIAGKPVLEKGEFVDVDKNEVYRKVAESCQRLGI